MERQPRERLRSLLSLLSRPTGGRMSILAVARRAYAKLQARQNGAVVNPAARFGGCDKSDQSDQSPPPQLLGPTSGAEGCDQSSPHLLVGAEADLSSVVAAVEETALVALDVETT